MAGQPAAAGPGKITAAPQTKAAAGLGSRPALPRTRAPGHVRRARPAAACLHNGADGGHHLLPVRRQCGGRGGGHSAQHGQHGALHLCSSQARWEQAGSGEGEPERRAGGLARHAVPGLAAGSAAWGLARCALSPAEALRCGNAGPAGTAQSERLRRRPCRPAGVPTAGQGGEDHGQCKVKGAGGQAGWQRTRVLIHAQQRQNGGHQRRERLWGTALGCRGKKGAGARACGVGLGGWAGRLGTLTPSAWPRSRHLAGAQEQAATQAPRSR